MKTVFVGLSGGVDSAVSAALLKERGYNVIGAFIKIWQPEFTECTWKEDRLDAMRVCAALSIPFAEIDLSDEYKNEVVSRMLAEYASGVTPNPDIVCNRSIKFGHFARSAFKSGADLIATGHYARTRERGGVHELLRGVDSGKDQSYFLYQLTQEDLSRVMFPVGEFEKSHVRALAQKFSLPVSNKPDSQGLCFVGHVSMKEFLSRYISLVGGEVVDENGTIVGVHDGAALYTIGERHGFSASVGQVHYVTRIDLARNQVHVSTRREDAMRTSVPIHDVHWIETPDLSLALRAQARYRETPFAVRVHESESGCVVHFDEPRIAAPGQSLVFYRADVCLGGGVIG